MNWSSGNSFPYSHWQYWGWRWPWCTIEHIISNPTQYWGIEIKGQREGNQEKTNSIHTYINAHINTFPKAWQRHLNVVCIQTYPFHWHRVYALCCSCAEAAFAARVTEIHTGRWLGTPAYPSFCNYTLMLLYVGDIVLMHEGALTNLAAEVCFY